MQREGVGVCDAGGEMVTGWMRSVICRSAWGSERAPGQMLHGGWTEDGGSGQEGQPHGLGDWKGGRGGR